MMNRAITVELVTPRGGRDESQQFEDLLHGHHRSHSLKIDARHRISPETRDEFNRSPLSLAGEGRAKSFAEQQGLAFSVLTSDRVARAFEIQREQDAVRDRYGRNKFGQSLLLSRRLLDAGVPIVQAGMGIVRITCSTAK